MTEAEMARKVRGDLVDQMPELLIKSAYNRAVDFGVEIAMLAHPNGPVEAQLKIARGSAAKKIGQLLGWTR